MFIGFHGYECIFKKKHLFNITYMVVVNFSKCFASMAKCTSNQYYS